MIPKNSLQRSIYITTNLRCNLRCVYCYEQDKSSQDTFDINLAKSTLKKELSTKSSGRGTLINFHGGEPFISYKKIKDLCEWAWDQDFPENFLFFATSNGTLVHGEMQDWLYRNRKRFVVGLSLDGTPEMHNKNRSNSYNLIDTSFFAQTWPNQGVKMTISTDTIHTLADGVIYMHELGFKVIRANLAEMTDWADPQYLSIYKRELQKLSDYYLCNPEIEKCSLYNVLFSAVLNNDIRKWCGAGTEMVSIDIDGSTYPCHLFFPSVCGKNKSADVGKFDFSNPEHYISKQCKKCQLLPICPTCYGANYFSRGHIAYRDLSLCELHKVRFAEVAKYEYNRIVNDPTDISTFSDEEKYKRIRTLEGIEKLSTILDLS